MRKKTKYEEELPCYEIVVDDTNDTGIRLISLTDEPAIEVLGHYFTSDIENSDMSFKRQGDKQIIIGPAMIPNIKIRRKDKEGNYYNVVFSKEVIQQLVQKFNSQGTNRRINLSHTSKMVSGYIMESWIIEDSYYDKSNIYGFNLPVGTYMISVKIEDQDFWETDVKELGKFGFSIEGTFGERIMEFEAEVDTEINIEDVIDNLTFEVFEEIYKEANMMCVLDKFGSNKIDVDAFELVVKDNLPTQMFAKNPYIDYYYYQGPNDDKTRDFCKYVLKLDKVYSDDDIINMSQELGYNLFDYMGGWNCRHNWVQFRGEFVGDTRVSKTVINNLLDKYVVK